MLLVDSTSGHIYIQRSPKLNQDDSVLARLDGPCSFRRSSPITEGGSGQVDTPHPSLPRLQGSPKSRIWARSLPSPAQPCLRSPGRTPHRSRCNRGPSIPQFSKTLSKHHTEEFQCYSCSFCYVKRPTTGKCGALPVSFQCNFIVFIA
jgi:hypothetical protein